MTDDTNEYGMFETPDDIAARPVTTFGRFSDRTVPDVRYAMVDGFRPLRLDLHLPPVSAGPFPVVVSIHGGGWLLGSNKIDTDDVLSIAAMWQALLDRGIAVAAVQYRLSREAPFPAALHDVKSAVRWLRAYGHRFGIDPTRIAAFGDSAGGYLSAFLATGVDTAQLEGQVGVEGGSSRVAAAVAWYPVTELGSIVSETYDWFAPDSMASLLIGAHLPGHPSLAREASPTAHVDASSAPLMLQHGDGDELVPYDQSVILADRYRAEGAEVEVEIVPGADHGFDGGDIPAIISRSVDFLARHLGV